MSRHTPGNGTPLMSSSVNWCAFCWCNPFAWLMKREIRTNLEYMADARVLENGYDSKTYQYHLLGLSHQKAAATIYNSFNVLPLKNASNDEQKENKRNRKDQISDVPSFSGLTYDCQQYRSSGTYHKEDCSGSHRGCRRQTGQAVPEVQAPQVAPLPEQDTKTVTYKGKVVDKDTLDNPILR